MNIHQQEDVELLEAYHKFWEDYLQEDMEGISSLLDQNYTQIGLTDSDIFHKNQDVIQILQNSPEQFGGRQELRNRKILTQQIEHLTLVLEQCDLYTCADSRDIFCSKIQISTLMEHHLDGWKILHLHASVPESLIGIHSKDSLEKIISENHHLKESILRLTGEIEVKNQELEIEAALDRTRSQMIAMRQSTDFHPVLSKIMEELKSLDLNFASSAFWIINPEDNFFCGYMLQPGLKNVILDFSAAFLDHPIFHSLLKGWRERKPPLYFQLSGELKKSWDTILVRKTALRHLTKEEKRALTIPEQVHLYATFNECGVLMFTSYNRIADEKLSVLERFGRISAQAYTRFRDIQESENKEKEVIKQSSLDRLRAEIASMRNSNDLKRITPLIWHELKALGVPFFRCGVFIIEKTNKKIQVYLSSPDGLPLGVLNLLYNSNQLTTKVVEHWRKGRIYRQHWNKADFINWVNSMIDLGQIQSPETYQGSAPPPESLDLHFVPFSQGMLYVGNSAPLSQNELELVKALAEAFSIAYARYLDFDQLEAAKNKVEKTLSDLKAAQSQLIQSEKMASLGQLTAGIAHELKNPLNFVKNFSELSLDMVNEAASLLEKEKNNDPVKLAAEILGEAKSNLEKVSEHSKRADEIIQSMLQHSRGGSGKKVMTNFNHLMKEAVLLAYHGMKAGKAPFQVEIDFELDQNIGEIPLIAEELSRAAINLCNNAFDAMKEKATKTLIENPKNTRYNPRLKVKTQLENGTVKVSFCDNGPGIPEEIKDKILLPFFTTKKGAAGTGLGLSITYDVVKVHRGDLKFETSLGEGTTFTIQLPIPSA